MNNIWLVEDDEDIRQIILYSLSKDFKAIGFENGADFFVKLEEKKETQEQPNMVILDIMLPGDDGLTILKKLRQSPQYQNLPIIMLTAKGSEHDKVKGLDFGADDYLIQPFGVMELLARVRVLLRQSSPDYSIVYTYKNITVRPAQRIVTVDGKAITLTYKEYELIHYLILNKKVVLSRAQILEAVWGHNYEGESRTLDMHIKRIRQKLGTASEHIKTIRSVGYKMGQF